jgi:hypothetical protein
MHRLLPNQFVDVATVRSMVGPILGLYRASADLASADDAAMAEAYMLGMVMPQEQAEEEDDDANDNIKALFGDDNDVSMPSTTDK